jgi:AcrR family transcriptional regulator
MNPFVFRQDVNSRGRARADEDKAKVRQAFVVAGRRLLATEDPSKVSLRRIAAEAGYSPGTIYSYFPNSRALYRAVRERDMEEAVVQFEALAASTDDPRARLLRLFAGTVQYWLSRTDQFDVLFFQPGKGADADAEPDEVKFGQTLVVQRALNVYYGAVEAFFDSLPRHPLSSRLATDALLAAVYGIISFPRMTSTMHWSDTGQMAELIVSGALAHWEALAAQQVA